MLLSYKVVMPLIQEKITTIKKIYLACACSCRRVYKPQVGSRSQLISWEPAEWDNTHFSHPLNVSDWTSLLAKLERNGKNKPTQQSGVIFTKRISAPVISDWDYCKCTGAFKNILILSHAYAVLCTSVSL